MALFNLVDNFFLLSVGIVFVLVFFLIYHFKTRIAVAEQKTDTLFRLMTVITRKVSSLFDSAEPPPEPESHFNRIGKSTPEVFVNVRENEELEEEPNVVSLEPIILNLSATEPASIPIHQRIVVSDIDSDSESSESDSDSESGYELDSDSETDLESIVSLEELEPEPVEIVDIPLEERENADIIVVEDTVIPETIEEVAEEAIQNVSEEVEETKGSAEEDTKGGDETKEGVIGSLAELKKMNINQLKTIAIQNGICSDTTKIKKNDLIQLILQSHH